jgi:pimeloyl-ACP methyl ester carboxylesterase
MPIPFDRHTVETPDGFSLSLFRSHAHRPRSLEAPARRGSPPVLLIPGFCSNRFTFGVRADHSLPRALNHAGRDVWVAELRGTKSSRFIGRGRPVIDIDRKLRHDLPAMLQYVAEHTRSPKVDLVGHSLGGLLALLTAGGPCPDLVGRVATLATPGTFKGIVGPLESAGPLYRGLARGIEKVVGGLELKVAPVARVPGPIVHLLAFSSHFLPGACSSAERRTYLDHAVEDLAGDELAQLSRWVRDGAITDQEGRSLEPLLAAVRAPVKVIAGTRDRIVSDAAAYATYAKVGSPDKRLYLVGRAHGHTRDYAHADLILAETARADVMEPLIEWLEGRSARNLAVPQSSTLQADVRPLRSKS